MTLKQLQENKELFAACTKEIEERVSKGESPEQAKLEVFKAHGVKVDEDALRAAQVEAMLVSDEELDSVVGGQGVTWCDRDNNCTLVYRHNDKTGPGEWCLLDYECDGAWNCVYAYGKDVTDEDDN